MKQLSFINSGRLRRSGFSVLNPLQALAFSCGEEFELYRGDDLYYFYPEENRDQTVRWAMIVDLYRRVKNGS